MSASVEELQQCLQSALSSDPNIRMRAELRTSQLLAAPEAGSSLSQLISNQNWQLSLRQMACIMLRRFVNERWSPALPRFKGPVVPFEEKPPIRAAVFQGLSDPESKIRSLCAQALTVIANSDWPDEWPDLLDSLMTLLSSNSPLSVHGAMQVLQEFIKADLTENQILPVLQQLVPILLNILGSPDQHSVLTRARAVSVFRTCIETLFMVKQTHPQAVKQAGATIIPPWLDAFKYLMNIDPRQDVENTPNWDGIALRIQIYKALDAIYVPFKRLLEPHIDDILTFSLNHLTVLYPTFVHYYLMGEDAVPPPSENEATDLPNLFSAMIDLISLIARNGKGVAWFSAGDNARSLTVSVFNWIQITKEDEDEWSTNANAFVAQESEDTLSFSVRVAGLDTLAALLEAHPSTFMPTIQLVIQQITTQTNEARNAGNLDWWRPLEAILAAVGSQAEAILDWIDDEVMAGRPNPVDIELLLSTVVPNLLSLSDCPFLQGRAFVFASQYTKILPAEMAGQYLHATVQVLEASDASIPIKVSAIRAVHNFCKAIDDALLEPVAPRICQAIGPFLSLTTDYTLQLVLDALSVIVEIDGGKWMTPDLAGLLVHSVLDVWVKHHKDPLFISLLTDILASLAGSSAPGVYEHVVKESLPMLCAAIKRSTAEEPWIAGAAIDLMSSLMRGAPQAGLGSGFVALCAPDLFQTMQTVEDREVIQNGTTCLTLIIRKDYPQLQSWVDPATGRSGLDCVLAVIAKQLKAQDEAGGLVIGDLVVHLLRYAGEAILPVLPELLQALISRMPTAKTATFIQSLIIPFAFLLHNQRDAVLTHLESINVDSRPALDILVQTWCENEETFQGFWAQRISTLALSSLYVSERPSLQKIMVKGDLIIEPEARNVIMTRARRKQMPMQFTYIHFPVKALKLLLRELRLGGEAASSRIDPADVESDDGDGDWQDDEPTGADRIPGVNEEQMAWLSDYLAPNGKPFDDDEAMSSGEDEDLRNDPVSQMDMRAHLLAFFRECAARNTNNFAAAVEQLTADEVMVVREAVNQAQQATST
ncbi:ARM repeat-containing protein [Wolfiporia cocos MD-104 SS10]|uniref:ARM repeat-containing protein n=1 Tax=Wolfiporia cocos (strain MD-104) TaxID=742152 RepID=A0A2H3JCH9_WOLCO|nr:ARM repeat-containing protein [Wolfiporia cocos MD-104 SS10]